MVASLLILGGIGMQAYNIATYWSFLRKSKKDILSVGDSSDNRCSYAAFFLLIFFLVGYVFVAVRGGDSLPIGSIFFFGALFCTLMIRLVIRLTSTIKRRGVDIVQTLIKVIEERDPNLNGHSLYVRNLSMVIWRYLPNDLQSQINQLDLEYAALLHDVGKLGIPESILNKPGKLSDSEWQVMREHPNKGVNILDELHSLGGILPWIRYHHERIDGKGYYGIPGDEVPLGARIIAVADTYSAITMERSYKPAMTYEEAIAILKDVAGKQLDARLVKVLCSIPRKELGACVPENIEVIS